MIKACLKAAASRLGIFQDKRGSKGDMAEMGQVRAVGVSLRAPQHPERVYLIDAQSDKPAATYFQQFKGRVQTPQGSKSVVNDAECAPPGTRFAFAYRFGGHRLSDDQIANVFALAMVIGLGSTKAFERGKFSVHRLTLERQDKEK